MQKQNHSQISILWNGIEFYSTHETSVSQTGSQRILSSSRLSEGASTVCCVLCAMFCVLCAVCCVLCSVFCVLCVPRSHVVCIWQDPSSRLTSGAHVAGLAALVMEAEIGNRPQRPQSMPQPRPPLPLTASPIRFIPSVVSPKSCYFLLNLLRHICLCFEKLGALQSSPDSRCIYDFSSIRFEGFLLN